MIFGALVVVLILLALAFLVIPVLKKPQALDTEKREQQNIQIAQEKKALLESQLAEGLLSQQEFDAGMADLEASLALDLERHSTLEDNQQAGKWAVWFMIVLVPTLSIFMYIKLGNYKVVEDPSIADPQRRVAQAAPQQAGKAPSLSEMIERVKQHLRDNPDDERGWFVLGRTLMSIQLYDEAVSALRRSHELNNQQPTVMLALADAIAMQKGGKMAGEPEKLVQQALAISPDELTGLWLAGLSAEQGGRDREAFDYFLRLLPMLEDDPESTQELHAMLVELKAKNPDLPEVPDIKQAAAPAAPFTLTAPSTQQQAAATGTASVKLSVTIDDALAAKARPGDLLFIYAKAASGPPMPLAAKRLKASDLPVEITLSDSDAMIPQMSLSKFDKIIVGARISKSGQPVASAGDLYAESAPFERSSQQGVVSLTINQVK
jgi:cytochrome c-type biogenesis protein CcmH